MGSHADRGHQERQEFLKELTLRAELMTDLSRNTIQNEEDIPVHGDYCNIRGDVGSCIKLLERAIVALKEMPE